jgi:hypothetical protein
MAQIAVAPITLTNALLTLGIDGYEKHVSAVELVPTATSTTWKGLNPDAVFTNTGRATWVCNLSFAQDWETPDSLSQYLLEHEGEIIAAVFEPEAGGAGFTANLVITPGSIGGAVDTTAVATVSLGVQGRPVLVPAV